MSITARQLTDDGSLLLTFAPSFAPFTSKISCPGSFTILIDPWLSGSTVIFHPRFATTQQTTKPAVTSLAEIEEELDLIIISQEKSDHLHRETLCTLPKNTKTKILAPRKAAKRIREWRYFDNPNIVQVLDQYSTKRMDTIFTIPIEPHSSASAGGAVTIANISQKKDLIGIHNAIAITYDPPSARLTAPNGTTVELGEMPMMSLSRPGAAKSRACPSPKPPMQHYLRGNLDEAEWTKSDSRRSGAKEDDTDVACSKLSRWHLDSPTRQSSTDDCRPPIMKPITKKPEKSDNVLSVIYTPHGIDAASLQPYVVNHLRPLKDALPVTALVHSLTYESNPWWMGGVICAGTPCGVRIAHEIGVKYWLSAHDGLKETEGLATKWLTSTRYDAQEATKMLQETNGLGRGSDCGTEVVILRAGEVRRLAG